MRGDGGLAPKSEAVGVHEEVFLIQGRERWGLPAGVRRFGSWKPSPVWFAVGGDESQLPLVVGLDTALCAETISTGEPVGGLPHRCARPAFSGSGIAVMVRGGGGLGSMGSWWFMRAACLAWGGESCLLMSEDLELQKQKTIRSLHTSIMHSKAIRKMALV